MDSHLRGKDNYAGMSTIIDIKESLELSGFIN